MKLLISYYRRRSPPHSHGESGVDLVSENRSADLFSWFPSDAPISSGIFNRGFYMKRGVLKYRHGGLRGVIDTNTIGGMAFCLGLLVYLCFAIPILFIGLMTWRIIEAFLVCFIVGIPLIWIFLMLSLPGISLMQASGFDLNKKVAIGSNMHCKNKKAHEYSFGMLFGEIPIRSIKSIVIWDGETVFLRRGPPAGLYIIIQSFSDDCIALGRFHYSNEKEINEYINGLKAVTDCNVNVLDVTNKNILWRGCHS